MAMSNHVFLTDIILVFVVKHYFTNTSHILWRKQVKQPFSQDNDDVLPLLDQPLVLDLSNARSLKLKYARKHVAV